jgi:hypothetical protein
MADERDIAIGVMRIASANRGVCTFKRAYREIPDIVDLDSANVAPSHTRPGEVMWQQLVRNIQSHHAAEGNFINEGYLEHVPKVGYRLTPKGVQFLTDHGYI